MSIQGKDVTVETTNQPQPERNAPGRMLPEHVWKELDDVEANLQYAADVMARAEKCGIDCKEFRRVTTRAEQQASKFRKHFGDAN